MALESEAAVIGYGGMPGGGKTDLLLGAALRAKRSIIFRRVFPAVRAIIERSREVYNAEGASHSKDSYNEQLHLWRLADGRMVEFGSLQYEKDKNKYQGRAYDLHGFDELTEFSESQFRFVINWNRSADPTVRPRVIATFNPPTDDAGGWVLKYFAPWIDPEYTGRRAESGELRWFAMVGGVETEVEPDHPKARSRTFILAKLEDNPALMAAGYDATLEALPEPLRSILLGQFQVQAAASDPWRVIPREWVDAAVRRWAPERPAAGRASLGVDPARGGQDQTVIATRVGSWYAPPEAWPGKETPDGPSVAALVTARLIGGQLAALEPAVFVDVIGIGASVYDCLRPLPYQVDAVNVGAAAPEGSTDRSGRLTFGNLRAFLWWRFREALDPNSGDDLALPLDKELIAELCAPRFMVRSGRIWVESKDEVRQRIGRSTDRADAVILAHEEPRWYAD